jgi:hypothetical protein
MTLDEAVEWMCYELDAAGLGSEWADVLDRAKANAPSVLAEDGTESCAITVDDFVVSIRRETRARLASRTPVPIQ